MQKIINSTKNINKRLFFALLVMGLCPTIYTTLRTFFLGELPGDYAFSIAGQLSWVNLLYEILDEAIILPLFFCLGSPKNKLEFSNKVKSGAIASAGIYACLAILIMMFAKPLLSIMAVDQNILSESASYIRIESVANIFGILYRFLCVAIIAVGKDKYVYAITGAKLILSIITDTFLISSFSFSFNLGVNGIGYSNIIVNTILVVVSLYLLASSGYIKKAALKFSWIKDYFKINMISGLESLVRNTAYILMVSRMVNMVGEQGTYWVANNFIWGWLLLPVLQLGELIKQETAANPDNIQKNTKGYFTITTIIITLWVITIPLYKPFMENVLNFSDVDKLFNLVMILLIPYITFAFQNIFDSTFYGRGKTNYMLFESVITNSIYYGGMFIAYLSGLWTPSLMGIAIMFGIGNIFDAIVSGIAYGYFRKKYNTNQLTTKEVQKWENKK